MFGAASSPAVSGTEALEATAATGLQHSGSIASGSSAGATTGTGPFAASSGASLFGVAGSVEQAGSATGGSLFGLTASAGAQLGVASSRSTVSPSSIAAPQVWVCV